MSEQFPLSAEFIKQLCAIYTMHEPLIAVATHNHRELKLYVSVLRMAIETSEEPNVEMVAMLTRLLAHMDSTMDMLKRVQALSKQVDQVMKEHVL